MGFDVLSPLSVAKVNVLLIPAGNVTRARFTHFVSLLNQNAEILLGDTGYDSAGKNGVFSSTPFPAGRVLFQFSTSETPISSIECFPFDLNREAQVVLALADGSNDLSGGEQEDFVDELAKRTAKFRRTILSRLMIFGGRNQPTNSWEVTFVQDTIQASNVQTAMQDITKRFLGRLESLADGLRLLPAIESPQIKPTQYGLRSPPGLSRSPIPSRPVSGMAQTKDLSSPALPSQDTDVADRHRLSAMRSPTLRLDSSYLQNPDVHSADSPSLPPPSPRLPISKGRLRITIGAIFVQAGRWMDALKELSEGLATARANSDYLWQARCLEYILVCMLVLAWGQLPFDVPSAVLSNGEKPTESSFFTPENGKESTSKSGVSLQKLSSIVPDVASNILALYAQAAAFTDDRLPHFLQCEVRIRLAGLLSTLHMRDGFLDKEGLDSLVRNSPVVKAAAGPPSPFRVLFRKEELANMLLKALPEDESSPIESITILVGISTAMTRIGLPRKQAIILKEALSVMIPALIEARKIGAAEAGIHPAAGLSTIHDAPASGSDLHAGARRLLAAVVSLFGVDPDTAKIPARKRIGLVGDIELVIEILRLCIQICEALSDLQGVLDFTVQIFQLSRTVITLPPSNSSQTALITPDEQARLVDNIKRTVAAASRLGRASTLAHYWDDLLVRNVEPIEKSGTYQLTTRSPQDLARINTKSEAKSGPFIYSSFGKPNAALAANVIISAGEIAQFAVLLQNPLEVDVEIEQICLLAEGCGFKPSEHNIVLGPYSTQTFIMSGTPIEPGTLSITGCRARIRWCREREFRIFRKQLNPVSVAKVKLRAGQTDERPTQIDGDAETVSLTVLDPQPLLTIASSTLSQPAIMLLEGETKSFRLAIHNSSPMSSADLMLVNFEDSATTQVEDALARRERTPAESHELSLQLSEKPSIRLTTADVTPTILPGQSTFMTFEVFGKPGLMNGAVHIDYGHIGRPREEVLENFHTRRLTFPISFTVNGAIEITRCNVLPFRSDYSVHDQAISSPRLSNGTESGSENPAYCMLLFDMRNVWPHPLSVSMQVRQERHQSEDSWSAVEEVLEPGYVSRLVLVLPRIYVPNPFAPIPVSRNHRQFVVSTSKLPPEVEAANREAFWYREELLKRVWGSWSDLSNRSGSIDLRRGIKLSSRMIDAMKLEDVEIGYALTSVTGEGGTTVKQVGQSRFVLQTGSFSTLFIKIANRSLDPLRVLVRLQPALRDQPHTIALDLAKRFAWSGTLQRVVQPPIVPGESREISLGLTAIFSGRYEIGVSVEEVRKLKGSPGGDLASFTSKRRIWHAREPCFVDAVNDMS